MKKIRKLNNQHDQIFETELRERKDKLKRIHFEDQDSGYMVFMI